MQNSVGQYIDDLLIGCDINNKKINESNYVDVDYLSYCNGMFYALKELIRLGKSENEDLTFNDKNALLNVSEQIESVLIKHIIRAKDKGFEMYWFVNFPEDFKRYFIYIMSGGDRVTKDIKIFDIYKDNSIDYNPISEQNIKKENIEEEKFIKSETRKIFII